MCQIWVQRSHFWRLLVTVDFDDSFITEVWSVDHIIIVNTSMVCAYGGLPKCAKFTCSGDTFGGCWLLLIIGPR